MIIDFHTHIFPDKIAHKTVSMLSENAGFPAHTDGTADGLVLEMERAGVDVSVALPVVTNPMQFDSINRFACEINERFKDKKRRIISFGGIHPDCEDIEGKMRQIKELGLPGVKLHPVYQGRFMNDDGYIRILECARYYDLIAVTHTGYDAAFDEGEHMKCAPELILDLIRRVPYPKLVLAHMGANDMMEESYDMLAGEDVYFDTGYMLSKMSEHTFSKMLSRHGAERILYATDSPWTGMAQSLCTLKSFGLCADAEKKILSENAKKLLNL